MLYGSKAAQEQMNSLGHYFNPSDTLEGKLGLAGANYELVQSLPKVLEYLGGENKKDFFKSESSNVFLICA
jgi:hypothetical protein